MVRSIPASSTSFRGYMVANFLENQPNKICRHLSKKALKGRVFGRQNHEGKGKDIKKKEREGRKENKTGKKRWLHS